MCACACVCVRVHVCMFMLECSNLHVCMGMCVCMCMLGYSHASSKFGGRNLSIEFCQVCIGVRALVCLCAFVRACMCACDLLVCVQTCRVRVICLSSLSHRSVSFRWVRICARYARAPSPPNNPLPKRCCLFFRLVLNIFSHCIKKELII